jgi:hypothetical protein
VPRQFVFNVDETRCCDFGDKREITVLIPFTYEARSMCIPVDRHAKRSALTDCIAANDYRALPFVIVECVTAKMKLSYYGDNASNITFVTQVNAFMTSHLFEVWAERVFFPAVDQRRSEFNYTSNVVLLIDRLGIITRKSSSWTARIRTSTSSSWSPELGPNSAARSHHVCLAETTLLFVQTQQARDGPVQQARSDPGGVVRGERAALQRRSVRERAVDPGRDSVNVLLEIHPEHARRLHG